MASRSDQQHVMKLNERPAPIMVRGEGSWLYDAEGKRYLDFVQGWAVNSLGHSAVEIQKALTTQAGRLLSASPAYHNENQLSLSAALARATGLSQVILASSGAEVNDCAIKLARKWGKRKRGGAFEVISTHNGFHGRTLATMAASGKPGWDDIAPPVMPGFVKVAYGDARAVADAITERTCAVLIEPIQGEAGVVVPPAGYLRQLRQLTEQRGVLLIADEIQTGVCRTGPFLHCHSHEILPDMVTLGKGLGGGVPIAALVSAEHCASFELGDHGGTFAGNPLTAAAALAVLQTVCNPEFEDGVQRRGQHLLRALAALQQRDECGIAEIRGAGLLVAIRLRQQRAAEIASECLRRGLLLNAPRPDVLRLMPQLRVSESEIALMSDTLGRALQALA